VCRHDFPSSNYQNLSMFVRSPILNVVGQVGEQIYLLNVSSVVKTMRISPICLHIQMAVRWLCSCMMHCEYQLCVQNIVCKSEVTDYLGRLKICGYVR
jgi:hypothetical protein